MTRQSARCGHGFVMGYCVAPGCPHRERRGKSTPRSGTTELRTTARRVRTRRCCSKGCPNIGTVPVRGGTEYSCHGCLPKVGSRANRQQWR